MVPTELQPSPIDTFCEPGSAYFFPTLLEHLMEKSTFIPSKHECKNSFVLIIIAYDSTLSTSFFVFYIYSVYIS